MLFRSLFFEISPPNFVPCQLSSSQVRTHFTGNRNQTNYVTNYFTRWKKLSTEQSSKQHEQGTTPSAVGEETGSANYLSSWWLVLSLLMVVRKRFIYPNVFHNLTLMVYNLSYLTYIVYPPRITLNNLEMFFDNTLLIWINTAKVIFLLLCVLRGFAVVLLSGARNRGRRTFISH